VDPPLPPELVRSGPLTGLLAAAGSGKALGMGVPIGRISDEVIDELLAGASTEEEDRPGPAGCSRTQ